MHLTLSRCGAVFVLGLMLLPSACALQTPNDERVADATEALKARNSMSLNGISLNGISLNGISLNGISLNGISLNGISLNGISLNGTSLTGTRTNDGSTLSGFDFIGAELTGILSNGQTLPMRVDDIVYDSADPDILLYTISYQQTDMSWAYLCGSNSGSPVRALPLAGRWDGSQGTPTGGDHIDEPSLFTFACEGYVLAKCVEFGYKPWQSVTECRAVDDCQTLSLQSFHQACTRMLRADYCGDGTPNTLNGTPINLWDNFDIQTEDPLGWLLEAEWTPGGAECVVHTRLNGTSAANYIAANCPAIWDPQATSCGGASSTFFTANGFSTPLASRVLLRNESNPQ